jgi:hypothetical protein
MPMSERQQLDAVKKALEAEINYREKLEAKVARLEALLGTDTAKGRGSTGARSAIAKALTDGVGSVGDGVVQRDGPEAAARLAKVRDRMFTGEGVARQHTILNEDGTGKGRGL